MALFSKRKRKQEYFSTATIITRGTYSRGGFVGNDSIHIDGTIYGDVKVNNVVIIGETGRVNGKIQAKQIISSGICQGNILCDSLELLENSRSLSHIKANKILLKGTMKGNIACGGLFVHKDANIEANIEAKNISTGGKIQGNIICKQIKLLNTSYLKGNLFADRITNEGGHVEGFIGRYSEMVKKNPQLKQYEYIFTTGTETMLLGHKDYYVDVQEELEKNTPETDEECIEAEFFVEG
ncbi:MAG: hypothetical protein DSZ05_04945 [Sulfurospirillum sp.]|nr:MAG: hypothetical protein DSZ05_04945 [Sulfurospirillum sp.]